MDIVDLACYDDIWEPDLIDVADEEAVVDAIVAELSTIRSEVVAVRVILGELANITDNDRSIFTVEIDKRRRGKRIRRELSGFLCGFATMRCAKRRRRL